MASDILPKKSFIGFDHIFDELEKINNQKDNYPPYNVFKDKHNYLIEIALAGFLVEDINITVKNNVLTITGTSVKITAFSDVYHQGISNRNFTKTFRLSEYTEVVRASFKNGLLSITLIVNVPKEEESKSIKINT